MEGFRIATHCNYKLLIELKKTLRQPQQWSYVIRNSTYKQDIILKSTTDGTQILKLRQPITTILLIKFITYTPVACIIQISSRSLLYVLTVHV